MKKILALIVMITALLSAQELTTSILVGGVTENTARFRIQLSDSAEVNVELSASDDFSDSIIGQSVTAGIQNNYAVIVDVAGLAPNTLYYYRTLINSEADEFQFRSFKTFPPPGTKDEFSFAFGSCQQSGKFLPSNTNAGNVFREIVKHDIRFFLQLGDWTYPDTTDLLPLFSNFFSSKYSAVLDSYRNKFNKEYPMDSLLRKMPVDYVYDDHDYMNNNSSALTSSFYIPNRPSFLGEDFLALEFANPAGARENSIKGYKNNFPAYPLANESRGIYHKFTFGNIEVFALDLRAQRDGDLNPFYNSGVDNKWVFDPSENHSILGRDESPGEGMNQLDWFLNELKNSTADWKFVMSSVPFNIGQRKVIEKGIELQDSLLNLPELSAEVQGIFAAFELSDGWAGYPADYDSVLSFIELNGIKNVIVMSGDSHNSAMDDGANSGLPEIMSGNLEITNSKTVSLVESFDIHIWNQGGQGITTDEFNNAFGKITVYSADSVRLQLIDEFGNIFAENTILNAGITGTDEEPRSTIASYMLYENYPNPFNPSTTIKYTISPVKPEFTGGSAFQLVQLKVYDILGRETAVLVDEMKSPGTYTVTFNADNLPSGVYIYRLRVNNYSAARKMTLLK